MSRLDELPPDQRAALSLLLRQHKSYAEVASLLGIAEQAVHDRAHAALAVLAPRRARELAPERRLEIGDYLLGQQPGVAERLRTRTYLSTFEPARAWASEIATQLAPFAGAGLPEIPAPASASVGTGVGAAAQRPQRVGDLSSPAPAAPTGTPAAKSPSSQRSSRVGGAVVLAVLAAAAIVAVVLISGASSPAKKASTTASTTTAKKKTGPTVDNQITLKSSEPNSKSVGAAYILSEGAKQAFFIEAQNIPAAKGFYYAIWLYNSPSDALPLSKSSAVGSSHKLAGGSALPSNAGDYREMLLTRETNPHPKRPGHVVLRGPFSLH
jgi:Sigma-70, region 4